MIGFIYRIQHIEKREIIYIGSTLNFNKRIKAHIGASKLPKKKGHVVITNYLREYGVNNFTFDIIKEYQVCDGKHLKAYEQLWINKLDCINKINSITCKELQRLYKKKYRDNNREKLNKTRQLKYKNNIEDEREKQRLYREKNKEKVNERYRKRYHDNNKKERERSRLYREKNKSKIPLIAKKAYEKRKDKLLLKIACKDCGKLISSGNMSKHLNGKLHIKKYKKSII